MKLDPVGTVLGLAVLVPVTAWIIRVEFGARTWRKPRWQRPRPSYMGIGLRLDHIPLGDCHDCRRHRRPCPVHQPQRRDDDFHLWEAELQPRVRRLRDRKDIPR